MLKNIRISTGYNMKPKQIMWNGEEEPTNHLLADMYELQSPFSATVTSMTQSGRSGNLDVWGRPIIAPPQGHYTKDKFGYDHWYPNSSEK